MRWAARCAAPGGANSSYWNPPPPSQPYNTNYYTYVDQQIQPAQNLDYALLEVKPTDTITLVDTRGFTPPNGASFTTTIMPVQYTYTCSQENADYCASREVFDYAVDTSGTNPYDGQKHSYGWVRWRLYKNTTNPIGSGPANWALSQTTLQDHVVPGTAPITFDCF